MKEHIPKRVQPPHHFPNGEDPAVKRHAEERRAEVKVAKGIIEAPDAKPDVMTQEPDLDENGRPYRVMPEHPILRVYDKSAAGRETKNRTAENAINIAEGITEMNGTDDHLAKEPSPKDVLRDNRERRLAEQQAVEAKISKWAYGMDPGIGQLSAELARQRIENKKSGRRTIGTPSWTSLGIRKIRALRTGYRDLEKANPKLYEQWVNALARRVVAEEEYAMKVLYGLDENE